MRIGTEMNSRWEEAGKSGKAGLSKKIRGIAVLVGALSCALMILSAAGRFSLVHALEQVEVDAKIDPEDIQTEAAEDALIDSAVSTVVDALSTDETEGMNPVQLLPEDVRETLNSLDAEEIKSYAIMIDRILKNPDFQELMAYDEVRDLLVTLVHNGLNIAHDDPLMTTKILTTLGVDKRLIVVFFALLEELEGNQEATEALSEFVRSQEGAQLVNRILETLDDETIEKLLEEFRGTMGDGGSTLTALLEAAPDEVTAQVPDDLLTEMAGLALATGSTETEG